MPETVETTEGAGRSEASIASASTPDITAATKEAIKKEIVDELKNSQKGGLGSLAQHPAVLLLLGFILTTGVGTWFTYYWQDKQQINQREQQSHERALQQKYEFIEQTNRAVAELYTAANVILYLLSYNLDAKSFDKELPEREVVWKQNVRSWLVTSRILQQRIAVNFKGDEAKKLYQEISEDSEDLSIYINEVLIELKKHGLNALTGEGVKKRKKHILEYTNGIRDKTERLIAMLTQEVQAEDRHFQLNK